LKDDNEQLRKQNWDIEMRCQELKREIGELKEMYEKKYIYEKQYSY
jgi:hypothetical protein